MSVQLEEITNIPGVGKTTLRKLQDAGYNPVLIAVMPARLISKETGVDEKKVTLIADYIRKELSWGEAEFISARDLYEKRKSINRISTGASSLDRLLGGGIETQAVTELVGEYGAGKTQLAHQLSVMVQLPEKKGGLEARALYIDTEGTFRPERIIQMAKHRGLDPEQALENIVYARAYNSDHQMLLVRKAFDLVEKENIKLVVLDSLISNFRSEYPGRENLASRQQKLNSHIHDLLKLAMVFNLAVVVTNQVVSNPEAFFGDPMKAAGGHVMAHGSTYRIWLKKGREGRRIAKIIDSPYHPESETVFLITEHGVVDV